METTEELNTMSVNEMGDQDTKKVKSEDTNKSSDDSQNVSVMHEEDNNAEDDSLLDDVKDDIDMNGNPDDKAIEDLLHDSDLNTSNSTLAKTIPSTDKDQGKSASTPSSATDKAGRHQKSTPRHTVSNTQTKTGTTDSAANEASDESIVVQVNDNLLNEIDSDLLDSTETGDGKFTEPANQGRTDASVKQTSSNTSKTTDAKDTANKQATANKAIKDGKSSAKSPTKPAKKDDKTSRNLWVSGLSSSTRATDLKTLFSKHGKVIGAKVVTNARSPGSRCYGFVTMGTADEATKCIQHLHRTELHGRMVSVERAKTEPQGAKLAAKVLPPSASRSITQNPGGVTSGKAVKKTPTKKNGETKDEATDKETKGDEKEKPDSAKKPADGHKRVSRERPGRPDRGRREMDTLDLNKIKAARERARLRNKELFLRHEERRRKMTLDRDRYKQQMREKRQREERVNLEQERRRLREMKEELERERMETERLKLETERLRIKKEQENYRREQQRVLEARRPVKRPIERDSRAETWSGNKRQATERFQQEGRQPVRSERKPAERFDRREPARPAARFESHREERVARQDRYDERDRSGRERVEQREFSRREEHRPVYREERTREQRPQRDERVVVRDPARVPARHDPRSEWKSDRETSRGGNSAIWNGPVDHKVQGGSWAQSSTSAGSVRQTGGWSSGGVVMSQTGSNYTMQPGAMINTNMGPTPVFIAQPTMQGTPVIMQSSLSRQGDNRYGMAASAVRRY